MTYLCLSMTVGTPKFHYFEKLADYFNWVDEQLVGALEWSHIVQSSTGSAIVSQSVVNGRIEYKFY